ncbi:MAG: hypothetical protein AAGN35_01535 [Bacteroidota bacterium]
MIQELIQIIINHLKVGLAGEVSSVNSAIRPGPITDPTQSSRPKWSLEAEEYTVLASPPDDTTAQPRPVEGRQRIAVNGGNPAGPYPLSSPPLADSLEMKVVFDEGLLTERSESLLPGIDFSVDLPNAEFTVLKDITGADALRVRYSFVGILNVQEFEQRFTLKTFLDTWTNSDRYLSLPHAIIASRHAEIVEQFNFLSPTVITANSYLAQPLISRIRLIRQEQVPRTSRQRLVEINWTSDYLVKGQVRLGQTIAGGYGIITNIRTPGQTGPGIDLRPDLG